MTRGPLRFARPSRRALGPFAVALAAACGTAPKSAPSSSKPAPSPPVASSAEKVGAFTLADFDLDRTPPPRRPLLPAPAPPPEGDVEVGDEAQLAEVKLGTAPGAKDAVAVDADVESLANDLRLVIDSPYEIFAKTGSYVHVAAFTSAFTPAAAARVFVDGKLRGRTDGNGTLVFRHAGGSGSRTLAVIAGSGKARTYGAANYRAFARTAGFDRASLYVYTDRGVFAPGELVHVRAFAWRLRGDYRPFRDTTVDVLVTKEGKVLTGGRARTDALGVASIDLPIPSTAPEGSYQLQVEHLGERATARLQIKPFVLPAVRIDHTLPRFLARSDTSLPFEVKLARANGGAFGAGTIVVRALDPAGEIAWTETRAVKGSGPHAFTLGVGALWKMRQGFADGALAGVKIEVIDAATGRHDELRRDLRIAEAPYRIVLEADRLEHVPGEKVKIVARVTDLEGAPVGVRDVRLRGDGIDQTHPTDPSGLATFELVMPQTELVLDAMLVKTPKVTTSIYIYPSKPRAMLATIAATVVSERQQTPIEVRFPAKYEPTEKVVHADVVDASGSLVDSFVVPITREGTTWVARGSFAAPSWGSMLLTLFALGKPQGSSSKDIGLLTDGLSLPVRASRPITVTLDAPLHAAPGATVQVHVGTKSSRPTELGAVIADDALLAMLDPLENTPESVLYNPERKVMASTGAQILTWPVVQMTWGPRLYDIALPPFGFVEGGPPAQPTAVVPKPPPPPPKTTAMPSAAASGAAPVTGSNGPDMDHDGIPDQNDKCPDQPETYNGYEDDDGCPDKGKVVVTSNAIVILPHGAQAAPPPAPPTTISIRTDFAPTSLWLPHLMAKGDGASFGAKLPDAVGTQRVTVVASDDRGGIGMATAKIVVDQEVSVRSDLPTTLTEGDELEIGVAVQNGSKAAVTGAVALDASFVVGAHAQPLTVGANGAAAAHFKVKTAAPGVVPFVVSFTDKSGHRDEEHHTLRVVPRGAPRTSLKEATLSSSAPLVFSVTRAAGDTHVEADLSLAFPSAVPMIDGLEQLAESPWAFGIEPDASRLLAAIAVEGHLVRTKASALAVARVHRGLQLAASELLLAQAADGGFGWRWDAWTAVASNGATPATSPYVTAHALAALVKLRETDIPIPRDAIVRARTYLLNAIDANGEIDVSNVAFWEGDGPARRRAAGMIAFDAIAASTEIETVFGNEGAKLRKLAEQATAIAHGGPGAEDPLTLAHAVLGLVHHARAQKGSASALTKSTVKAGVVRLLEAFRTGYWEPSWFHGFGGRVEATRAAIELLTTLSPGAYEADLHDAVQWLLSTKSAWGAWHDAWGTAAAIDALAMVTPAQEQPGAKVSISVDGKVVRSLVVDARDPFVSAASLRAVDLGQWVTLGKHEIRVDYDGALSVPAALSVRTWRKKAEGLGLKIERALASTVKSGARLALSLKIVATAARPEVDALVPLGTGLEPDVTALDAMISSGKLAAWRREGTSIALVLRNVPAGDTALSLPLRAARKGTFALPAASAWAASAPDQAFSDEATIAVQ